MSGVIDENGQQWEHCNVCAGWVKIQDLYYEQPSEEHPCGLDLCYGDYVKRGGCPGDDPAGPALTIMK